MHRNIRTFWSLLSLVLVCTSILAPGQAHTLGAHEAVTLGLEWAQLEDPLVVRDLPRVSVNGRAAVCVERTDPHFEAIYARPYGVPDRMREIAPLLKDAVDQASAYMDAAAQAQGGRTRYKVLCDADGAIVVHAAALPSLFYTSPAAIAGALADAGFKDRRTKYIIFYDGCNVGRCPGGWGTIERDSSPGRKNANNRGPSYAINFGVQGRREPSAYLVLHEAGHTLGAVQLDAPNSDGGWHCVDAPDIMCGLMNSAKFSAEPGPCGHPSDYLDALGEYPWDCGNDDYFNLNPSKGSYLATHFNIATDSLFLSRR